MVKAKKCKNRPLSRQARSKAYLAPMGGAGPHRDRKNDYRRQKKVRNSDSEPSGTDGFFVSGNAKCSQ